MNINQIISDIKLFCDPFTDIVQQPVKGKKRLTITRNGRDLTFDIDLSTGVVSGKNRSIEFKNIRSLLASPDFADIRRYAETQQRSFKSIKEISILESQIEYSKKTIAAGDLISCITPTEGKSNLILLDGPAGIGKTFQITELAKAQSGKYLTDNISPPILHISSSGRRLSNFKDVLAATTQDMGASFGGLQVPMLVRHGLLIAAIDGFDELVDADGYEDSWRALKEFIEDVGASGTIILAARDTFLDEQEFLQRINSEGDLDVSLSLAHIKLASPVTAFNYLTDTKTAEEDLDDLSKEIFSSSSYALRPFFLRVLKEAGGWKKVQTEGLRAFLVKNLIDREAKILSRTLASLNTESAIPALTSLFEEVALEMAVRENNLIENEHLTFLADYCFSGLLEESDKRKIMHKAGSISLLELSNTKNKRQFPHTEVQFFFLGKSLINQLANRSVPNILRRTILGAEHLDVFAEVIATNEPTAAKAMQFLQGVMDGDSSHDRLATNGGALILLSFSSGLIERVDYVTANDATFSGGSPIGTLHDVEVSRLDACGCNLSKVSFEEVKIGVLVVDEFTKFGDNLPAIGALEIRGDLPRVERDPNNITKFIEEHTTEANHQDLINHPMVQLLGKIARRSIRYCYLRDGGDDDEGTYMLRDPRWTTVKRVLDSYKRVEIKKGKSMHGRPAALVRIKKPVELLDLYNEETQLIMKELAK
ncbi:hypothetical protein AVME950_05005 [Acidovorax sp. SUPP950]|uniref:hypothetical protein n=1 Tax=Acidovorax sp. SUPP950 TaxID=511901 RepID=UPI0023C6DD21|nr:hypothetical protein [Acidovorax sp. SUPP950]GKS74219.1 hypothetical protein AVME950_05005 [Acidovorax sp. SUPP950]